MSVILDNPLAKKNLWLVGFPALQNSTVVYWDAYKTMEGECKSACSYQKCNYGDLKGGFESLHINLNLFLII